MSRVCQITKKRPMSGHNVSHSNIKTKRRFLPNLHWHRFWLPTEQRFVRLLVSTKAIRTIDKHGIEAVLAKLQASGDAKNA
ncbi:MAG: 50S ribosomal protein L28 [Gammaproteobacteria bacterium]